MNSIAPGDLPPHILKLKKGAPLMLLRNINPKSGLCNGTRLLCRGFYMNMLDIEILQVNMLEKRGHRSLTQETLKVPKVSVYGLSEKETPDVSLVGVGETWMTPYRCYRADGMLLAEPMEAKIIKKNAGRYTLVDGELFRHGYTHPILTCVGGDQCTRIMAELHEGICGSHVGGRALSLKVVRAGYYWPTMREDCMKNT